MMKFKKIFTFALVAASLTALTVPTASANVMTWNIDSEEYKNIIENYCEFDDSGYLSCFTDSAYSSHKIYYDEEYDCPIVINYYYDHLTYKIPDDENAATAVGMAMQNHDWIFRQSSKTKKGYVTVSVDIPCDDKAKNVRDAAEFAKKLKNVTEVVEFKLINDIVNMRDVPMKCSKLFYAYENDEFSDYIKSLDIDYKEVTPEELPDSLHIEYQYILHEANKPITIIVLTPDDEMTIEDRFRLMQQIYEKFGLRVLMGASPESAADEPLSAGIDMANNILGDANRDGEVNIADATAIIQAIGNPDKYRLTPQGEFNADINGDGLTGLDAIAIQQLEAGIIKSL